MNTPIRRSLRGIAWVMVTFACVLSSSFTSPGGHLSVQDLAKHLLGNSGATNELNRMAGDKVDGHGKVFSGLAYAQVGSQAVQMEDESHPAENKPDNEAQHHCILTDSASGARYDLSALHKLNVERQQMFIIRGAEGGPYDTGKSKYNYHFSACGLVTRHPPTDCANDKELPHSPAYQYAAPDLGDGAGSAEELQEDLESEMCYSLGHDVEWSFSLLDEKYPQKGVQIHYTGGDNCYKREIKKTKTASGRDKREVVWVPTERSATIKFLCNPDGEMISSYDQELLSAYMDRKAGHLAHAFESEMCHYTLEWESPYGCPTNLKNIKTKYFEDFEDDDYDFYEDYAGIHSEKKITKKRKKKVFFLFKLLLLSGFAFCCFVGVQMVRYRKRMKILLPQITDIDPAQKALARKKFFKLIFSIENPEASTATMRMV